MPADVHLVGSMLFRSPGQAMRAVATTLDGRADWIPDGETGERALWLTQHQARFLSAPGLAVKTGGLGIVAGRRFVGVAEGAELGDVELPELGYARWAAESAALLDRLIEERAIDPGVRFLQALPTPLAFVGSFIHPDDHATLLGPIEAAIAAEIDEICAAIPHERLAIQWDVAIEFAVLEGAMGAEWGPDPLEHAARGLARAVDMVPGDVPVCIHLCYGAPYDIHFVEPRDTALMVELANRAVRHARRPVERLHLPVPRERDDGAFFAPLSELELSDGAELYLGLVHHEDGVAGGRRRIAAARRAVASFGVATECGSGRTAFDPVALLALQAELGGLARGVADPAVPVPDAPSSPPTDTDSASAAVRALAETIACPQCEAAAGVPCSSEHGAALPRPHYPRYQTALLERYAPAE